MQMDSSKEAGTPEGRGQPDENIGAQLFAACAEGVLEAAGRLLESGQRFVIVARTLPAAVRLRETLAPTVVFDEAGLPIAHPADGRVALYRAQALAPRRRALLQEHAAGRVPGLILTAADLAAFGTLEAFAAFEPAWWLVDDAHCLSLSSAGFVPALRQLEAVHARGLARALWLFAPFARAEVVAELRSLFGIEEQAVHVGALSFPETVGLHLQLEPRAFFERNLLSAALRRYVTAGSPVRGVIVAPLGTDAPAGSLPVAELESVVGEVGAEPVRDPGEGLEAGAEAWAALYRRPHGIVLTENPEAIEVLSSGASGLVLRLIAPASPETVLEESLLLARQGGGHWGYLGPAEGPAPYELELDVLERLGRTLAESVGAGQAVALDAQELAGTLGVSLSSGLDPFARALEHSLDELVGAGYLGAVRPARFQLEVAESHRFNSPHIDNDARYLELKSRYDSALSRMGMLQSVKYRLNALPPKDLRVLAGFLEYPVSALNALFDDLAREGLIICRQVVSGSAGNLNFEVVGRGARDEMLARLPGAIERIAARRQRARAEREAVARLVTGTGESVIELMAALEVDVEASATGSVLPEVRAARPTASEKAGTPGGLEASAVERGVAELEVRPVVVAADNAAAGATAEASVREAAESGAESGAASGAEPGAETGVTVGLEAVPATSDALGRDRAPRAEAMPAPFASEVGRREGAGTGATRDAGKRKSAVQESFERLVSQVGTPLSVDDLSTMLELADALASQGGLEAWVSQLSAKLAEQEDLRLRTLQVLLLQLADEGENAALAMKRWLETSPPAEVRDAWLPIMLSGIDYRFEASGTARVGGIPEAVRRVAMLLPVVEGLAAAEAVALVRQSGFAGDIAPGEFGSSTVLFEDQRYTLVRQSTPPEVEAALWLAVEALDSGSIPAELARARVIEGYLMVAGLAEEALTGGLAARVVGSVEQPAWVGAERRRLALARIHLAEGRTEAALEALNAGASESAMSHESGRLRAEVQLKVGQPLAALRSLAAAGVSAGRGEGQALWQSVNSALMRICEAHSTCESCPLLNSEFCPSAQVFWGFVEQNPYNEGRRALRTRVEKRARHGLELDSPQRLVGLMERFPGQWDEALVQRWIAGVSSSRPEEWLTLAQRLVDIGAPTAALQAVERVQGGVEDTRSLVGLSRIRMAAGDLNGGIELARRAAAAGGRAWDEVAFCRELDGRLGRSWETRLEALTAEIGPEGGEFLSRLAEGIRTRGVLQAQRKGLEAAIRSSSWRELRESLTAYRELAGEAAERDSAVREAQTRLTDRERRVTSRIDQILAGAPTPTARAELTRLAEEAEQLGLTGLTTRAREALASSAAAAAAADAAPASAPLSTPIVPVGERGPVNPVRIGSRPDRPGERPGDRSGERRPPEQGRRGGEGRRPDQVGPRPARDGAPQGQGPQGAREDSRRPERPRPQGERGPRDASREAPRRAQDLMEEPAILLALKEAKGDRERVSVVMPAVYEWLAVEPERGIRLLKDALPLFQFQNALDRPMAEVIREGRPDDGTLPRLRRVLEKDSRSFISALGELSSREHPEPWKRVLGQLKLKS